MRWLPRAYFGPWFGVEGVPGLSLIGAALQQHRTVAYLGSLYAAIRLVRADGDDPILISHLLRVFYPEGADTLLVTVDGRLTTLVGDAAIYPEGVGTLLVVTNPRGVSPEDSRAVRQGSPRISRASR